MYTQCPDCTTVYEISPEHLGAASGMVRCGVCDTTFNALRRLSETAPVSKPGITGDDPSAESGTAANTALADNRTIDDESATEVPGDLADPEDTSEVSSLVAALLDDAEEERVDTDDVAKDNSEPTGDEERSADTEDHGDDEAVSETPDDGVSDRDSSDDPDKSAEEAEHSYTSVDLSSDEDSDGGDFDDADTVDDDQADDDTDTTATGNVTADGEQPDADKPVVDADDLFATSQVLDEWDTEEGEQDLEALLADETLLEALEPGEDVEDEDDVAVYSDDADLDQSEFEDAVASLMDESQSDDEADGDDTGNDREEAEALVDDFVDLEGAESLDEDISEEELAEAIAAELENEKHLADELAEAEAGSELEGNGLAAVAATDSDLPGSSKGSRSGEDSETGLTGDDANSQDDDDRDDPSEQNTNDTDDEPEQNGEVTDNEREQESTDSGANHEDPSPGAKDHSASVLTEGVDGQFDGDFEDDAEDLKDLGQYLAPKKSLARRFGEGSLVALLIGLLAAQYVHYNRTELATHPKFGTYLHDLYGALGRELRANWSVEDYRVARHTIVPSEDDASVLMARATVVNNTGFEHPLPLIRLQLKNRWGDSIFGRVFTPAEYLESPPPAGLAGNGRLEISLNLVHPAPDEEIGYSFDVCLDTPDGPDCGSPQIFND